MASWGDEVRVRSVPGAEVVWEEETLAEFWGLFGDRMRVGETRHFRLAASRGAEVRKLGEEAETAWGLALAWLGHEAPAGRRGAVILVDRDDGWAWLSARYGLRPDGLAFQVGRAVYLRDDPGLAARPDRIPHEVVHLALAEVCGEGLPLWLEEGLAGHWGWRITQEMAEGELVRTRPGIAARDVMSLRDLGRVRSYPADAAAFYRLAEETVKGLEEELGEAGMAGAVRAFCGRGDEAIAAWLRREQGWSRGEVRRFEQAVRERCRNSEPVP